MLNVVDGLTFDDVLLVPKHSEIKSRSEVDLSVELSRGVKLMHPIIPANMKTISGIEMCQCISETGGMAILHRFMHIEEQLAAVKKLASPYVGVSVGVKPIDYENVDLLYKAGARIFCIDIAHGNSKMCVDMTQFIAKYPEVFLIAGNVATANGAKALWLAGADCVKVGIGPGSLCSTRIETGNGVPQLTALSDVADVKNELTSANLFHPRAPIITKPIFIIADGGIKNSGDACKSLCFADMVMIGNLFAGCVEAPGDTMIIDGKQFKRYDGSSTHKTNHIEGITSLVPSKGKASNIIEKLCEGIKSGCSYQGVNNLINLKKDPKFVRITNAGLVESHPKEIK